jgi:hypothetical membrane protein
MAFCQKIDAFLTKYKFEYFGIAGSVITAAGIIITALGFAGYSVLNHFISELGMQSESPWAVVFNIGLIAGGLLFLVFLLGTQTVLDSRLAKWSRVAGYITAIGTSFVGIFPADVFIWGHIVAAQMFFIGGLFTVLGFSVAILRQKEPKIGKWMSVAGAVVVVIFVVFVIELQVLISNPATSHFKNGLRISESLRGCAYSPSSRSENASEGKRQCSRTTKYSRGGPSRPTATAAPCNRRQTAGSSRRGILALTKKRRTSAFTCRYSTLAARLGANRN